MIHTLTIHVDAASPNEAFQRLHDWLGDARTHLIENLMDTYDPKAIARDPGQMFVHRLRLSDEIDCVVRASSSVRNV